VGSSSNSLLRRGRGVWHDNVFMRIYVCLAGADGVVEVAGHGVGMQARAVYGRGGHE
jgi:hypothetical protein